MCGIVGWVDFGDGVGRNPQVLDAMTDAVASRGPDGRGRFVDGPVALGHTRLAIIDLAGGFQPMQLTMPDGRSAVLTFNGEIYNFRALRRELQDRGHHFRTAGDTEVLLRSYLEWGERCVERLDGMFAFAIWDIRKRQLLLARDRLGIKPLQYAQIGRSVVFASEAKSLLLHPAVRPVVDSDGMREALSMARVPGSTVFQGIKELAPGTVAVVGPNKVQSRRYWQLRYQEHTADLTGTIEVIRSILTESVELELVADVPVALLLSGGLDSSTLTALAAQHRRRQSAPNVQSMTVTYAGYRDNFQPDLVRSAPDDQYASDVAEHVGSDHTEIILDSAEMMDASARTAVLLAQDKATPFGDMDTSTYLAFKAVRERCSVALIGEVADEIFGGYSWVHIPDLADQPIFPWIGFEQWHPGTRTGLGRGLFDPGLLNKLDFDSYYADNYLTALTEVDGPPGEEHQNRRAREICHLHLTRWLPMLLDRIDRLSGSCGLEVRVPFCDHRLVEYMYNVPWVQKTYDGREKSLLRAVAEPLLPAAVLGRPKSPFPVSQDPAYGVALYQALDDMLHDRDAPIGPLLDKHACGEAVKIGITEPQDWLCRMNAEMVLHLNAWLQVYHIQLAL